MFDVKMKKLTPAIVIALAAVGAVAWCALNLRAKRKYDHVRDELAQHSYAVVPFDQKTTAFLAEVRTSWTNSHSQVGGPHSDAIKLLGLRPSVSNLVHVFTHRLPAYSFLSLDQNKKSAVMAMVQGLLMPVTMDNSIHRSEDGLTALVRCQTNLVYVFSDEPAGLRESMYYLKKGNIEQAESTVPVKAAPSASSTVR
jgi:hypothetical protein